MKKWSFWGTKNDQIWLFFDFDSFEKLNLMSKLLKWSCWFQCVWIWNLLLSLLWLKCKYCITTQKTVCLAVLGKIIDVDWHKNVCFYATIDEIARSWSYGSFTDSYLFFFDQIYHKTHFYTIFWIEKIFFCWTDTFFKV